MQGCGHEVINQASVPRDTTDLTACVCSCAEAGSTPPLTPPPPASDTSINLPSGPEGVPEKNANGVAGAGGDAAQKPLGTDLPEGTDLSPLNSPQGMFPNTVRTIAQLITYPNQAWGPCENPLGRVMF